MAIVSALLLLGILLFAYRLMLRPLGQGTNKASNSSDSSKENLRLQAVGFFAVAVKLSIILLDTDTSGGLFQALLVGVLFLAVAHVLMPTFVEMAVGFAAVLVAIGQYFHLIGAPSHGLLLGAWLLLVIAATGLLGVVLGPGLTGWFGGENRRQLGALAVGLGAVVLMGVDFFDPIYQDAWAGIFSTVPSTLGWFVAGLILAIAVSKAPELSALALGAGLIISELIVRAEYCRLVPSETYSCGHFGSALVLVAVLVATHLVARRLLTRFHGR